MRRQTLMASPTSTGCHTVIATAGSPLILGHIPSQSLLPLFLKKKPPRSLQAAMVIRTYMYQPRIKWKLLLVVQNPSRLLWRDPHLSFHRRYLHLLARLPCLRSPCQILMKNVCQSRSESRRQRVPIRPTRRRSQRRRALTKTSASIQ